MAVASLLWRLRELHCYNATAKRLRLVPSLTFAFGFLLTNQNVARGGRSRTYDACNWLHF